MGSYYKISEGHVRYGMICMSYVCKPVVSCWTSGKRRRMWACMSTRVHVATGPRTLSQKGGRKEFGTFSLTVT